MGGSDRGGAGAAVLAGALAVSVGGSFTPSMAIRMLESSCSGMLPSSEEKGLGGFSRHISQLVLPVNTGGKGGVYSRITRSTPQRPAAALPDGLRMKISAQPWVSMGTNSARLGLSLRGGGAAGAGQDEDGGPRPSREGPVEAESGAASSPSEGDTRGLRF